MARATIIQFWNVTPKSANRSVSQLPTGLAPHPEKVIRKLFLLSGLVGQIHALRRLYNCRHAIIAQITAMAMITTFQFWNVTPKTVNPSARKPPNGHLSIPSMLQLSISANRVRDLVAHLALEGRSLN
jgi:hypothetical protein